MDNKIPITPFEIIRRTKDMPKILEWLERKHLIVSGPEFWGIHHVYIDNSLKHVALCLKADLTTHVFIGNPTRAEEWRKYDKDVNLLLSKELGSDSLEWKMYKDIALYKGKMLPPKEISEEPYWGKVVEVEAFSDNINDPWIVSKIKNGLAQLKDKRAEIDSFKQKIREQEDQLFGITLYFQNISFVWANNRQIVEMNKEHYENIMKRGREAIARARQLLNEAQENPKLSSLRQFTFPPTHGNPMLDEMTKQVKVLVGTYHELFPGRPKEKPLTKEEILHLTEVAISKTI